MINVQELPAMMAREGCGNYRLFLVGVDGVFFAQALWTGTGLGQIFAPDQAVPVAQDQGLWDRVEGVIALHISKVKRIDPSECACTDCLTGYSLPINLATPEQLSALKEGRLINGV